jgi:hypothetical protein
LDSVGFFARKAISFSATNVNYAGYGAAFKVQPCSVTDAPTAIEKCHRCPLLLLDRQRSQSAGMCAGSTRVPEADIVLLSA